MRDIMKEICFKGFDKCFNFIIFEGNKVVDYGYSCSDIKFKGEFGKTYILFIIINNSTYKIPFIINNYDTYYLSFPNIYPITIKLFDAYYNNLVERGNIFFWQKIMK